ncbi:MAG: arsenate reductase [Gammaproteobacteria bacterium]|jgi:arsenate reductase
MTTIYHNPSCSKSRATLSELQERELDFNIVKYLDTPPSAVEILELISLLGDSASEIIRTGEPIYKELGLNDKNLSNLEWAQVLADNPKLIERPIVVHNGKAAIGRPIERVIDIL